MNSLASSRVTRRSLLGLMAATAGGVLAACAAPSLSGSSAAVPAAPAKQPQVELTLGHFASTSHEFHAQLLAPFAADVEQRSGGRIRVVIHPGGALGPAPSQYKNVQAGAMDIAFGVQSYTPGRFPLTEALELPFLWTSAQHATHALQSIYQATPALRAEYADTHLLAIFANGPAHVMTTRRQIKTLEDVQGLKLRSPGPVHNKVIEALGAAPLSMPASEQYDALERGVVNGTIIAPSALTSFNLADVVRYMANARFTVSTFFVTMNRARYESLSMTDQQVIDASAGHMLAARSASICDTTEAASAAAGLTRGVIAYELPAEELERWRAATRHISDEWLRSHEAHGVPARATYEQVVQLAHAATTTSRV